MIAWERLEISSKKLEILIGYDAAVNRFLISKGGNFTLGPQDAGSVTQSFV